MILIMWDDSVRLGEQHMLIPKIETINNDSSLKVSEDVFDAISNVVTFDELWDVLQHHVSTFGLTTFTYYHMPPAGSRDYDANYHASRGKNPSLIAAQKSAIFDPKVSFIHIARRCNNLTIFDGKSTFDFLTDEQESLFKTLHMADITKGFVIPVHCAKGRSGCFVLETDKEDVSFPTHIIRQLKWICEATHTKYCEIKLQQSKTIKQLTARERQILSWVARGKSNSVIADIIGISQHTVNGYLRSIYLKTGTSDRTTAALRGIGEALIDL